MFKIIPLLFISTFVFAQPISIHWSSQSNYLVDQDGKKTEIQGHPSMVCYEGLGNDYGIFQKSKGRIIWLINASRYIEIDYPVCDLKK